MYINKFKKKSNFMYMKYICGKCCKGKIFNNFTNIHIYLKIFRILIQNTLLIKVLKYMKQ